jgi:hypothetical protein
LQLIKTLLIRNEWRGAEVEDLVCAQLAPFADLIGSRIVVRGPKLRLNAAAAQAIGLALHELATNAGKYDSLSTDAGRLYIGWRANGDTFTMCWTEREQRAHMVVGVPQGITLHPRVADLPGGFFKQLLVRFAPAKTLNDIADFLIAIAHVSSWLADLHCLILASV